MVDRTRTSKNIKKHNMLFKDVDIFKEHKQVLQEFVDYLSDKNIEPVILVAPFHKDYLDGLGDNKKILEENLPAGDYRFIDLNKVPELKFEDDDFIDVSHTNMNGAKKVADFLNPILDSLRT